MKVSVIIPNFNGYNLLKKNLPVVLASFHNSEVIVVDDNSKDGSVGLLEKYFPKYV